MPFHQRELSKHFIKHGTDFQAATDKQYEALAENFMTMPAHSNLKQCRRRSGDILRYGVVTEEFAIQSAAGLLRTYYKPVPCWKLPLGSVAYWHPFRDNPTYFNHELSMMMMNLCPECGFPLDFPDADNNICPSCGTEFGYSDLGRTHKQLRANWLKAGAP